MKENTRKKRPIKKKKWKKLKSGVFLDLDVKKIKEVQDELFNSRRREQINN